MALLRFGANLMDAAHRESRPQILAVTANIGEDPSHACARARVEE
jgi:hypothetical protein